MDIEKIVRELIDRSYHMSLATARDNKPWVCELHFAYDEDLNFYFRSLSFRRHCKELTDNSNVAGSIVKQHTLEDPVIGVFFEGTAKLLTLGEEQNKAFECIKKRLKTSDDVLDEAKNPDGHQFYKIMVSKFYIFGAFEGKDSQKYELDWKNG
ncbi:MAG TPA: pyridoxamine 5'-phosphate oxidase family protein [Candidatus Saccharimonadia bacterium]|nr:pyridoxamine 5'-phosphate oxidase family protein [Candidatus Saccharimonadia bacterium]